MRPTVLIDLDHVVYDFVQEMAFWLADNGVLANPIKAAYQSKGWKVWEEWGMSEGEFMRWWRLGVEAGWVYAEGTPIPGARDALWKLSDANWDIHIATMRLNKFGLHHAIIGNTIDWLKTHNIPYRQLSFMSNKKDLRANAIVDDVADNMDGAVMGVHNRTFLFPANHNQTHQVGDAERRKAWENIVEELVGE